MEAPDTTRGRIRSAAIELFTQQGYDKTSLREIADRVGITKASLYYHYPSKQALLLAIVEPFIEDWTATVDAAEHLPHTPENVRFVLERQIDVMLRHRLATAMFARDVAAVVTALAPRLQDMKELTTRLYTWLAGPDPTPADRVRAMAVGEVLRTPLSVALGELAVPDEEMRQVVLDAAARVLGPQLPAAPPAPAPRPAPTEVTAPA